LKYKLKVTAIKSVFSSLTALLMLATLITGATSFQTTFAQPMMGESNMGVGNGGGAGGMNFNNPMSFANNIFNASSLYGSVGISMVNGVKVTSISVLENNEISVTLRHSAATPSSNATTAGNNVNASTTMSSSSSLPQRVTVTAIRIPMNLKDLLALASQSSKMATNNSSSTNTNNPFMMGGMQGYGPAANNNNTSSMNNINPLSFITKLQIGSSSTMANADWALPQTVRMGLTSMMGSSIENNMSTPSTADFIIVSVIPYTGK
jgi:hypothetical protein